MSEKSVLGRGKKSGLKEGDVVAISPRCGDFGKGRVVSVADTLDAKGRHMVAVAVNGRPDLKGDALPHFEAGLLEKVSQ
jgi:hypothetical protein